MTKAYSSFSFKAGTAILTLAGIILGSAAMIQAMRVGLATDSAMPPPMQMASGEAYMMHARLAKKGKAPPPESADDGLDMTPIGSISKIIIDPCARAKD